MVLIIRTLDAQIIYVNESSTASSPNGSSWGEAFTELQEALQTASAGDSIWVSKGTYKPTLTSNREISFVISDSVRVYGGFDGTEPSSFNLNLRDFDLNETILSGDVGEEDEEIDNSYHVIFTSGVSSFTTLNGITIANGFAHGFEVDKGMHGGGWYNECTLNKSSNPTIYKCLFIANAAAEMGGAIFNMGEGNEASPNIDSCDFKYNTCLAGDPVFPNYAGAIANYGENGISSPTITNSFFLVNESSNGGAIFNNGINGVSNPFISNCFFESNLGDNGGAILNFGQNGDASPTVRNCSFKGNCASAGSAIYMNGYNGQSSPNVTSCVFLDNEAGGEGGAVYFTGDGIQDAAFDNCLFNSNGRNHVRTFSGDYILGPSFTNCTFFGSTDAAVGQCERWDSNSVPIEFTNCIFWENNGATLDNNVSASVSFSIVEESEYSMSNNNIFLNPYFKDAANGDFSLKACSPGVDAGTNIGVDSLDILGVSRIFAGIQVDIGAYEFQGIFRNTAFDLNSISIDHSKVSSGALFYSGSTLSSDKDLKVGVKTIYKAAGSIQLNPGFKAEAVQAFETEIGTETCP